MYCSRFVRVNRNVCLGFLVCEYVWLHLKRCFNLDLPNWQESSCQCRVLCPNMLTSVCLCLHLCACCVLVRSFSLWLSFCLWNSLFRNGSGVRGPFSSGILFIYLFIYSCIYGWSAVVLPLNCFSILQSLTPLLSLLYLPLFVFD